MKTSSRRRIIGVFGILVTTITLIVGAPGVSAANEPRTAGAESDEYQTAGEAQFHTQCSYDFYICQNGDNVYVGPGTPQDYGDADGCGFGPLGDDMVICYTKYGDYIWVKDKLPDGKSAVAAVYRHDGGGHVRYCRNLHGTGSWAKCNFNWVENQYRWHVYGKTLDGDTRTFGPEAYYTSFDD